MTAYKRRTFIISFLTCTYSSLSLSVEYWFIYRLANIHHFNIYPFRILPTTNNADAAEWPAESYSKISSPVNSIPKPMHHIVSNRFWNRSIIVIRMLWFIAIWSQRIYCWQVNWKGPPLNWPILDWLSRWWAINRHGLDLPVHLDIYHRRCWKKNRTGVPLIFGHVVWFVSWIQFVLPINFRTTSHTFHLSHIDDACVCVCAGWKSMR